MQRTLIPCLAALLSTGCATHEVPVVPPAPVCRAPVELTLPCPAARPIAPGATFADLLATDLADRSGLAQCAATHRELAQLLAACQASVATYNARLDNHRAGASR